MSLMGKVFGMGSRGAKSRGTDDQLALDRQRSRQLSTPAVQSKEEQASVREHMEAELTAQRERRQPTP